MEQSLNGLTTDGCLAAVKDAYRRSFSRRGETGRRDFLYFTVCMWCVLLMIKALKPHELGPITSMRGLEASLDRQFTWVRWSLAAWLLISVPLPALYARRLRNLGQSGYWAIVIFAVATIVTGMGMVADIALCALKGNGAVAPDRDRREEG